MQKLLTGDLFVKVLQYYGCQDRVVDYVTGIIRQQKASEGIIKVLLSIIDCRPRLIIPRLPVLFFEAVFEYRFIKANLISKPDQPPEQDTLKIGAKAAEELTEEEFNKRAEEKKSNDLLNQALKIINPPKDDT